MNFRLFLFTVLLTCVGGILVGQKVHIYNIDNLKPIPEVFIIDHNFKTSVNADKNGIADLSVFKPTDTLIFQHPSFYRVIKTYQEVTRANNTVYMTESAVDLKIVTVTANKRQQLASEVPNVVVPITKTEIELSNSQTAADVLENSGEVFIQKSQMGGGSPMLRGFSANRVLIVVDGVRMNNAIFRGGNLHNIISIDPNNVEGAEVILGPGSVIYGSDALGGVMSFATTKPKLSFKKDSSTFFGDALLRYSSANTEKTAHFKFGMGGEKFGAVFGYTYSNYLDLRAGSVHHPDYRDFGKRTWYQKSINGVDSFQLNSNQELQISSAYEQHNFMLKTRYQPSNRINMELATHYSTTSDIPRYDRLVQEVNNEPKYALWEYGPQKWFLSSFTTDFSIQNDAWDRVQMIAAYQYFEESRKDRRYRNSSLRTRTERVNALSLNVDFDKLIGKKHTLFYGLEGVYNSVFSEAGSKNISTGLPESASTRYPDNGSYWASTAAYITYKWKFNKKINFSTGIRYTYISMESNFKDTTFYKFPFDQIKLNTSAFNGSFIGVTYHPNSKWNLSLNTASGFRAPNIDDIAKVFDSEPGKVILPNSELKPEYTYNSELSISRELSYKGKVELVGFYTYMVDAMVRRKSSFNGQDSIMYDGQLSEVQKITNAGKAHIYGASINIKANITKKIGVIQTFTWIDGEDLESHVALRHVSPAFGKTSVFFRSDKFKAELFSHYNAWKHWEDLAPEEQGKAYIYTSDGTPAWFTLNLRSSYQFNENINLSGAVENILDHHYRPYSSGISAAGINFILAARVKF